MHIEDRESVIARLLQPEPLPTGFKRRNPKAYRYTPYSRKIMRRLDLYTPPVFDLWIHIEWDRKISKFNERVQKLMIPGDAGQFLNLTPAIVTVDENEKICIHVLSGGIEDITARSLYTVDSNQLPYVTAFAKNYRLEVATWTPEKIYANPFELDGWKQLLRYFSGPDLIVQPALRDKVATLLKGTRKTTITALLESLPDEDPDWVMRALAVMLQDGLVHADFGQFQLGYATEISIFHEFA